MIKKLCDANRKSGRLLRTRHLLKPLAPEHIPPQRHHHGKPSNTEEANQTTVGWPMFRPPTAAGISALVIASSCVLLKLCQPSGCPQAPLLAGQSQLRSRPQRDSPCKTDDDCAAALLSRHAQRSHGVTTGNAHTVFRPRLGIIPTGLHQCAVIDLQNIATPVVRSRMI